MRNFTLPSGGPAKLCAHKQALAAVFMTGVSTLALFAAMPVNGAAAADCTVSNNTISGQTDCSYTNSGTLTSPEGGLKIDRGSEGVSVTNQSGGEISGSGGWSGIMITQSDDTIISNAEDATITGEGTDSAGISVTNPSNSGHIPAGTIINNAGSVSGDEKGIYLEYFGGASIVNTRTGTISGGSDGIYAYSSSGILDVDNNGTITGNSNRGIYIANITGARIINTNGIYGLSAGIDVNGASEISLTNSGTISSTGNGVYYGVNLQDVDTATIVNSGTISSSLTGQDRGMRLAAVDNATITNSGNILGGYYGIELVGHDSSAEIVNSGTISGGVFGIWGYDTDLTLSSTGTINGGVRLAYGGSLNATNGGTITGGFDLAAINEAIISNSGTISGDFGGIVTADVGTVDITNSGLIDSDVNSGISVTAAMFSLANSGTVSSEANGVYVRDSTASIVNSGTISGVDYGIFSRNSSMTITSSGTISGGTASILFSNDGNTLNVLQGAVFDGVVDYNGTVHNTTNFGTGSYSLGVANYDVTDSTINLNNAHQTLILTNTNTSGGTVNVVDANSASMDSAVRGYANSIGNVLGSILSIDVGSSAGGSSEPAGAAALGYAEEKKPTGAAAAVHKLGDDTAVDRYGNLFWIRAFGGQTFDNARDTSSTNYGVAAGVDRQFDDGRFGVLAGVGRIVNKADDGSGKTTGNTGFGGVYVRKDAGGMTLDASLIAGGIDNDSRREIFGSDAAHGSFTGWYVSPEIAISQKHELSPGWTFTPSARLRYTAGFYDGYTETGSTQNVTYDDRTSNTLEGILEGKITNRNELANGMKANVSFSAALVDTLNLGSSDMNASLSGTDFTVSAIGNRNLIGGRFGLSGDVQVNAQTTLYSGVTLGTYSSDIGSWSANTGLKVKF